MEKSRVLRDEYRAMLKSGTGPKETERTTRTERTNFGAEEGRITVR